MPERIPVIMQDIATLKADMRSMGRIQSMMCKKGDHLQDTVQETRDAVLQIEARFEGGRWVLGVLFTAASVLGGVVVTTAGYIFGAQ